MVQVVLSTAHPAKFSEAVARSLVDETEFTFDRDVLPEEFKGLLERERRVVDVDAPEVSMVKDVIEDAISKVASRKVAEETASRVSD